ncbi:hypothetical protein FJZ17_04100 [Candidatus Pacearchaeota archaeon]|nr:hypothetical protein [Candidatus Pacearchaeota archaeon]
MSNKVVWAWFLTILAVFCLYSATTCQTCFGCKPTFLEPCSVIFMLLFLILFASALGRFRANKASNLASNLGKSKKKKR